MMGGNMKDWDKESDDDAGDDDVGDDAMDSSDEDS